jgi:hypothetical protein
MVPGKGTEGDRGVDGAPKEPAPSPHAGDEPETPATSGEPSEEAVVALEQHLEELRTRQRPLPGLAAGGVGVLAGLLVVALFIELLGVRLRLLSLIPALLLAEGLRRYGRGFATPWALAGAAGAALAAFLASALQVLLQLARLMEISLFAVLAQANLPLLKELLRATTTPLDLLIYLAAAWLGFRLSVRRLQRRDVEAVLRGEDLSGGERP